MKKIVIKLALLISFTITLNAQETIDSSQTFIRNANILDFQTNEFRIGNILIVNDTISKIQFGGFSSVMEGVINFNFENKYLIPGLIDAHVHLGTDPSNGDNFEDTKARLEHLLLNGITTVRDMAGDTRYLGYLSRLALLDDIPAPDVYFSALFAGESFFKDPRTKAAAQGMIPGQAPWMRAVNSATDLDLVIAEAKGTGASGIKIYADLDYEEIQRIVAAAHYQNMKVWAHSTVFPAKPSQVCAAGVDVMSHATYLAWEGADEVPSDATHRHQKHEHFDVTNPRFPKVIECLSNNKTILDATVAVYGNYFPDSTLFNYGVSLTKLAYEKKVKIGVGTDLSLGDLTVAPPIFKEMNTFHRDVGMRPIDIIRAATLVNAEMIGKENSIGSIEVGKKANIVVLKSNPLVDIGNCSDIGYVIKNGKVFKKE